MANDRTGGAVAGPPYLIHTFEHRAYPLTGERALTIGRDTACDIVVNEVAVSRHHVEVRAEGGEYVLHAVGATPTRFNETLLTMPQVLREGDSVVVGTMRFVFTRERLPVAMAIAPPVATRFMSGVDDRRPTLTFPRQDQTESHQPWGRGVLWVVVLLVLAVIGYLLYRPT
jgi:hypothetical protein